jgi:hypothetical protein
MPAKAQSKSTFDVHPAVAMAQSVIAAMKEKTGRSLEDWLEVVGNDGPPTEKERRDWLKAKHGLGTNYAGFIAETSVGKGEQYSPEGYLRLAGQYVEELFALPKAGLRPIYDALLAASLKLGKDVRVCPCQTFVPLYRNHVFAQIKPATRTRVDFGLALKDTKTPKRLIDTGGFAKKDRITRRIEISSLGDIDDEVRRWMKAAYDMDA